MTNELGIDRSGNNNNWTVTNMTLAVDQVVDSPTNNFATWNPVSRGMPSTGDATNTTTFKEGNLRIEQDGSDYATVTMQPTTGKWYGEVLIVANSAYGPNHGFLNNDFTNSAATGAHTGFWNAYYRETSADLYLYPNGTDDASPATVDAGAGDILQWAWDCDNAKLWG